MIPFLTQAGEYRLPLMATPPQVDGRIQPAEWAGASRIDGFGWTGQLERRRVSGFVAATATHLYLAIRSELPAEGALLAEVNRGDTEQLVYDDAVEFWVNPAPDAVRGRSYQLLANSLGHRFGRVHPYGGEPDDLQWRGADWLMANGVHDGFWEVELAIPVASLAPGRVVTDGAWGINLCRDWKQPWAWSALDLTAYKPNERFIFTAAPGLVVDCQQRGDSMAGDVQSVLVLRNPTDQPQTVTATLQLTRDVMPELKQGGAVEVPARGEREVALQVKDFVTQRFTLDARVVSADGATTNFSRQLPWRAAGPWRWVAKREEIRPVDFQFGYYPYSNRLRIRADASNLPTNAVLEKMTAVVRPKDGAPIASVQFDDRKQERELALPPLEGVYEIALQATGPNVPTNAVVREFTRTKYEWEHTALGTSTKVYPPFTPIQVRGARVATVLREHTMNGVGLWDQVVARQKPLLAAPMRWESDAPVKAHRLRFTQKAGHHAVATGGFQAGALRADVTSTWDYDGTMRVDATLQPTGGKTVNTLTLVIPLRADAATHLHAMGDGIRNAIYARLPATNGVIWTARAVRVNDLPANFCSYLYVGTPVRGLSWFAENNRGWGWNPETPNVELVREGGQVLLRAHLINQPTVITEPRTLSFGLLAAPVKPRLPSDWRHKWRRDNYTLLGTDINWFAFGDCGSVYPAGKDLYLWEMLARSNRERLSDAEAEKVVARAKPYFEPYGQERVEAIANHIRANLRDRYGKKMVFYYNRSSYRAADEFQTFQDEWRLTDFRTEHTNPPYAEIQIVPSTSYIDHALYWYVKSFEHGGNQGVYWDNWFFVGTYNRAMTSAYARPDGTLVPSTGLWALRELAKRTFQMMNERGMFPLTMAHMTSVSILPMLSFATVQYDWEWKYSEGDVQDRFPREYIQLVSDGELAGTWPVLLHDHGPQADDPWVGRTYAAVCMLHELDRPYFDWSNGKKQIALFRPVDDILAQPGVEAYRYWDERPQPVHTDNPDLPAIVYVVKGRETVFAIVSYAGQDTTARITIDAAALGFPDGFQVVDAETGAEQPVTDGQFSVPIKKHDIKLFRITPQHSTSTQKSP